MNSGLKALMLTGLLALAAGGGWYLSRALSRAGPPQYALLLTEPAKLPEFTLTDQDGRPLTAASFEGHWSLLFFGFTHCPDICPATLQQLAAARRQMADDASLDSLPDILLISVDPERDSPELLRRYVTHFGEGVGGATGPVSELEKLTSAIGIFFRKDALENGDYQVAHSAQVIVIDDTGRYRAVFSPPHSIDAFVQDLPRIIGAP